MSKFHWCLGFGEHTFLEHSKQLKGHPLPKNKQYLFSTVSFECCEQGCEKASADAAVYQFRQSIKSELRWEVVQQGVWVILLFMHTQQCLL